MESQNIYAFVSRVFKEITWIRENNTVIVGYYQNVKIVSLDSQYMPTYHKLVYRFWNRGDYFTITEPFSMFDLKKNITFILQQIRETPYYSRYLNGSY